ncbi:hypothetical protein ACFSTA_17790 [Ornithinibacillus salinisoli]|uniref:Uncharacterized protein n=1 Tax=Ornithinibacillus salinisoli TaxID=1848459 RepID=A0ABW4W2H1_9BACI
MSDHNNDHFDLFIKEVLGYELDNSPTPPLSKEEAWQRIKNELREYKLKDGRLNCIRGF